MNLGIVVGKSFEQVIGEIRDELDRAIEDSFATETRALHAELRQQTIAAGLGSGNANSWRVRIYRDGRGRPVGFVWSRAPLIMQAFEFGAEILPRKSGRFLVIPTQFNRKGGRRGAAALVTPRDMLGAKNSFVTRNGDGTRLWWLRVGKASRVRAVKATKKHGAAVVRQGITDAYIAGRLIRDRRRREQAIRYGAVPMFVLLERVRLDKRLDIAGAAERTLSRLAHAIPANWRPRNGR